VTLAGGGLGDLPTQLRPILLHPHTIPTTTPRLPPHLPKLIPLLRRQPRSHRLQPLVLFLVQFEEGGFNEGLSLADGFLGEFVAAGGFDVFGGGFGCWSGGGGWGEA